MAPLPLSSSLTRVTVKALDRKSVQLGMLLAQWSDIVGERFGAVSCPVKLARSRAADSGAVLHLAVPSAWSTEIGHELPVLKSRINAFFGHGAIREIRIVPRTVQATPRAKAPALLPPEDRKRIETALEGIENPRLREALLGLGSAIRTHGS